jgi:hypothetical protein
MKLVTESATLVQADKDRTTVITTLDAHSDKIQTFLAANNFPILNKDPTNKYQTVQYILQQCNLITDKLKKCIFLVCLCNRA